MSPLRTTILLHIISAYCILVTLCDDCWKINRSPPSRISHLRQIYCGSCLPGFQEDSHRDCIKIECPSIAVCSDQRRHPCDQRTRGECGECYPEYFEVEGVCVSDSEVESLIKHMESVLTRVDPLDVVAEIDERVVKAKYSPSESQSDPDENAESDPGKNAEFIDENGGSQIVLENNVVPAKDDEAEMAASGPAIELTAASGAAIVPAAKRPALGSSEVKQHPAESEKTVAGFNQLFFFGIVLAVSLVCIVVIVVGGVCGYRLHKKRKLAEKSEYQGYGGNGEKSTVPRSESGDRRLAHSAQMYHFQHHKQNMLSLQKSMSDKMDDSETDEEHEMSGNEEAGDDRVYECPGLAPTGEMEVQNPLFLVKGSSTTSPTPAGSPTEPAHIPAHIPSSSGSSAPISPVTSEKQHSATSSD